MNEFFEGIQIFLYNDIWKWIFRQIKLKLYIIPYSFFPKRLICIIRSNEQNWNTERKGEREVTLRNGKQKGWIFTRKKIVSLWFGKYLELLVVWFLWKEKKKETPMSEKTWRFREKTSDFGQHWFYYPLFGNPISGENCLKNDLTIRPVFKRGKKIPPFALIKRRR